MHLINIHHAFEPTKMKSKYPLIFLLIVWSLIGGVSAYCEAHRIPEPSWWAILSALLSSIAIFSWYYFDSELRRYRRSKLQNICMIVFTVFAVPFYLLRSRPKGQKGKALLLLLGYFVLVFFALITGSTISAMLG